MWQSFINVVQNILLIWKFKQIFLVRQKQIKV